MSRETMNAVRRFRDASQKATEEWRQYERMDGAISGPWTVYDSVLEDGTAQENLKAHSIESSFRSVVPKEFGGKLKAYIEAELAPRRGKAVGVELGGPGSELFAGFSKNFFARSLGTVLTDMRTKMLSAEEEEASRERDEKNHHEVKEVDIFSQAGATSIQEWLGDQKADLIIERMYGGLRKIPTPPKVLHLLLDRQYRWLNEGGILLNELSFISSMGLAGQLLKNLDALKRKYPGGLEIDAEPNAESTSEGVHTNIALRIKKLSGAPASLSLK